MTDLIDDKNLDKNLYKDNKIPLANTHLEH